VLAIPARKCLKKPTIEWLCSVDGLYVAGLAKYGIKKWEKSYLKAIHKVIFLR
jgi:hypothetical protein